MTHVPYRGGNETVLAIMTGEANQRGTGGGLYIGKHRCYAPCFFA